MDCRSVKVGSRTVERCQINSPPLNSPTAVLASTVIELLETSYDQLVFKESGLILKMNINNVSLLSSHLYTSCHLYIRNLCVLI